MSLHCFSQFTPTVLEKIFVRKNDMVTKEWKKLYNEDFLFVLFSDIVIKPRSVKRKV